MNVLIVGRFVSLLVDVLKEKGKGRKCLLRGLHCLVSVTHANSEEWRKDLGMSTYEGKVLLRYSWKYCRQCRAFILQNLMYAGFNFASAGLQCISTPTQLHVLLLLLVVECIFCRALL